MAADTTEEFRIVDDPREAPGTGLYVDGRECPMEDVPSVLADREGTWCRVLSIIDADEVFVLYGGRPAIVTIAYGRERTVGFDRSTGCMVSNDLWGPRAPTAMLEGLRVLVKEAHVRKPAPPPDARGSRAYRRLVENIPVLPEADVLFAVDYEWDGNRPR